jgi:hypothetical protein
MRRRGLIASLAATAPASCLAKLARAHSNPSALDRCTRAFRVLAVVAVSLVSFAHEASTQQPVRRIAFLSHWPPPQVLHDELRARGYDVGRNLQIEYRITHG